ncbi:MAG: hypothetical protein ACPGJV_04640 [Bacteriovoracaceae bacterium]
MKCLDLTDIQSNFPENTFEHFIRVGNLYIASKIESSEQLNFIKMMGINHAIDLKSHDETSFNDKEECRKAGIKYSNFPVNRVEEIDFDYLQNFKETINQDSKTLIYCISGNRVGALLTLYASLVDGHPKKRAIEFGEKVGMRNELTKNAIYQILNKENLS